MGMLRYCSYFFHHNGYSVKFVQKYIFFTGFYYFLSGTAEIDVFSQDFHYGVAAITLKLRFYRLFGASRAGMREEPDKLN